MECTSKKTRTKEQDDPLRRIATMYLLLIISSLLNVVQAIRLLHSNWSNTSQWQSKPDGPKSLVTAGWAPRRPLLQNETKSGKYLFFTFSRALYTPSAVKYKGSKFVVSQTLLTLTKIIGKIIFMTSN